MWHKDGWYPRGGGGDTRSIHDRGLRMELHIANPPPQKKKLHEPESLLPKKDLASKFPTQQ